MKKIILLILFLAFAKMVIAQTISKEITDRFEAKTLMHEGKELPYRIMLPKDFDASKKYPLHLFLHGAGERGSDNLAQLVHGSDLFVKENDNYPAIVIFPQCPAGDYWADVSVSRDIDKNVFTFPETPSPTWAMRAVITLFDQMVEQSYIDKNRIYLGGLSMGGMGTFELLNYKPDTFAAATPICGAGYPSNVSKWATQTDAWIFHGKEDAVVPVFYSQLIIESLLKNGAEPRITLYNGVNHDSWTNAFAEPDLFSWIYAKTKKEQTAAEDCTPEWLKFTEATLLGKYRAANENLPALKKGNKRIVFMGDSITEGWLEASPDFWNNHPEYINRGVGGQTTPQMLVRYRQDVLNLNPTTVVLLAGTNDIAGNTGETSIDTVAANIFTMAELAKARNIKVVIASILPVYDYPWKPGLKPAEKIIELNKKLKEYAATNGHTYLDYHKEMKNSLDGMLATLTYDGVHCTKEGYEVMENILLTKLKK